jgi:hypothetical protein
MKCVSATSGPVRVLSKWADLKEGRRRFNNMLSNEEVMLCWLKNQPPSMARTAGKHLVQPVQLRADPKCVSMHLQSDVYATKRPCRPVSAPLRTHQLSPNSPDTPGGMADMCAFELLIAAVTAAG